MVKIIIRPYQYLQVLFLPFEKNSAVGCISNFVAGQVRVKCATLDLFAMIKCHGFKRRFVLASRLRKSRCFHHR